MRSRKGPVNGHPLWRGYNIYCMFHVEHNRRPGKACLPRGPFRSQAVRGTAASADSRSPARVPPWSARPLRGGLRSCRPRRTGLQPAGTPASAKVSASRNLAADSFPARHRSARGVSGRNRFQGSLEATVRAIG